MLENKSGIGTGRLSVNGGFTGAAASVQWRVDARYVLFTLYGSEHSTCNGESQQTLFPDPWPL